jgi:hypothetical protein
MNDILYETAPEDYPKLDLSSLSKEDLRELAYYTWSVYSQDGLVMAWREEKLLPLLAAEVLDDE